MQRYRFHVEYNGAAFHGWQIQNGASSAYTVQAELEHAFKVALRAPVSLVSAGRTDAGVHGRGQCSHFDWEGDPIDCGLLEHSINGIAHSAVCIRDLQPCDNKFHARHSALSRYYKYIVYSRPVALAKEYGWQCGKLNINADVMEREAQRFIGIHDFDSFSIPRNDGKPTLCNLTEFRLERQGDTQIWHIRANRFLHRQVRAMIGVLVDVGRFRHPEGTVDGIFAGTFTGQKMWAPPEGLCLEGVEYPDGY